MNRDPFWDDEQLSEGVVIVTRVLRRRNKGALTNVSWGGPCVLPVGTTWNGSLTRAGSGAFPGRTHRRFDGYFPGQPTLPFPDSGSGAETLLWVRAIMQSWIALSLEFWKERKHVAFAMPNSVMYDLKMNSIGGEVLEEFRCCHPGDRESCVTTPEKYQNSHHRRVWYCKAEENSTHTIDCYGMVAEGCRGAKLIHSCSSLRSWESRKQERRQAN